MKIIPLKFYHQRARTLSWLLVLSFAVYFITRFFVEYTL